MVQVVHISQTTEMKYGAFTQKTMAGGNGNCWLKGIVYGESCDHSQACDEFRRKKFKPEKHVKKKKKKKKKRKERKKKDTRQ